MTNCTKTTVCQFLCVSRRHSWDASAHTQLFFNPISRWALAPVFQLLDIRREPGLSPFGYQFVSLEDSYRCA